MKVKKAKFDAAILRLLKAESLPKSEIETVRKAKAAKLKARQK